MFFKEVANDQPYTTFDYLCLILNFSNHILNGWRFSDTSNHLKDWSQKCLFNRTLICMTSQSVRLTNENSPIQLVIMVNGQKYEWPDSHLNDWLTEQLVLQSNDWMAKCTIMCNFWLLMYNPEFLKSKSRFSPFHSQSLHVGIRRLIEHRI